MEHEGPPQAPDVEGRIRLSIPQRMLIPVLILIPVLALAGVFGERIAEYRTAVGSLAVHAAVPTRLRYRQRMTLRVTASNRGDGPLDDVRIQIDSAYSHRFSGVAFSPPLAPDGALHVATLAPGAAVVLSVSLEGDRVGLARGAVVVTDAKGDTIHAALSSLVFP